MSEHDFDVARALFGLRDAVRDTVVISNPAAVRKRADHRRRVGRASAVLVAAVVGAAGLGGTLMTRWTASPPPPIAPTPGPPATPEPRPSLSVPSWPEPTITDPIAKVSWANATITLPARAGCPSG